jgi:hypothetical protein
VTGRLAYIREGITDVPRCYLGVRGDGPTVALAELSAIPLHPLDDSYVRALQRDSEADALAWLTEHIDEGTIDRLLLHATGTRPRRIIDEPLVNNGNENGKVRWVPVRYDF